MDKRETAAFRDQQADAMGSVNDFVGCNDEHCDESERWKHIKEDDSGWQVSNDPEIPLLCPSCRDRTPEENLTPTEAREEHNQALDDFTEVAVMGSDRVSVARDLLDGLREGFHYSVLQRSEVDEERAPIEVVWNHANEPGVPPRRDDFTDRSESERHRDLAIERQRHCEDDSPEMEQATLMEVV